MPNDKSHTTMEEVEYVAERILPAFADIPDAEYRKTIAGCWARAAINAHKEFQDAKAN